MMPALICGNTVVIKPAEDTPLSVYHLVQMLTEAGVPAGVVNLVSGSGRNVGAPLSKHLDVPVVSFTGSTAVGRLIAEACAPDFKHCSLEMGGKNIIIVMDDANLDLAVDGAIWGGFGTTGQRRTAASRLGVHKKASKNAFDHLGAPEKRLRVEADPGPQPNRGPPLTVHRLRSWIRTAECGTHERPR